MCASRSISKAHATMPGRIGSRDTYTCPSDAGLTLVDQSSDRGITMAGRPGRSGGWNRLPASVHAMRGTKPRTTRPQVPPPVDLPPLDPALDAPPADLDGDVVAQAEWRRILPTLRSGGVVTALDVPLLIALTQQWSRYCEALQQVRRLGLEAPASKTYLRVADRALKHYRDLWRELRLPSM